MRKIMITATALAVSAMSASAQPQPPAAPVQPAQPSQPAQPQLVLPGQPAAPPPAAAQPVGQLPLNMIPLGPPPPGYAYVPQAWMPQAPVPMPYAPVPAYTPPGYPPVYAPQGYVPAPPVPAPPPSPADLAFQTAIGMTLPLTNDMSRSYRQRADQQNHLVAEPASGQAARPVSRSITLNLRPGERPPSVRLEAGNATVLTFSDQTGAPWPVTSVAVGNPQAYAAQEAGEKGKTNMVVISPLAYYGAANLIVTLVGMPVPVSFSLETGKGEVDYRLDVGVPGRGPNAQYDLAGMTSLAPVNDANVQSFLDGVAPRGARKVKVSRHDVDAWRFQDMVYLRTALELVSPAYIARARNVSGVSVYTLADAPVVVVSQDGRMSNITIDR
jgi:intracellular multiplication protein IcmK